MLLRHGLDNYAFNFDKVFGVDANQPEIFEEVSGLVQSALDGYKVCIFAYGQTGSGKTYTMQGESGSEGLIPRALLTIFNASKDMKARGWTFNLKVSFMEVYNETLRDLLRGSGDAAAGPTDGYVIAQHEQWGTMVTGMNCIEVDSIDKINSLMARAAKQRAVGATDVHAISSRSHSVFGLYIKGVNQLLDSEVHGALHLVDLAGSERLDKSGSTGERLKETRNINRSLSSLADVFAAKAEGRGHVPFRNSKLTHLMEPCLSGQGKTLMLVSVAPEQRNAHETLCSLRFAKQVSQCNTGGKPRRSVKSLQSSTMSCSNASPRAATCATESRTITQKSRLSSDRSAQQVAMRKRAASMEPALGASLTPRGRTCTELFKRVESDRSARGASVRPLTAREVKEARRDICPERGNESRTDGDKRRLGLVEVSLD
jgi:kinesin family protein C1